LTRRWRAAALAALACLPACEDLPNVPPTATFIYSPVSPILAGRTAVVFNAAASLDSDGRIVSYLWNFGDGSAERNASEAVLPHTFPNTPAVCLTVVYAVQLTVLDDAGGRASASQNVSVVEDCPAR
jgi:hypothetical protein